MPTYTVTHSSLALSPEQKSQIAKGVTEVHYRRLMFGSSDHDDPAKRPRLVVKYSN